MTTCVFQANKTQMVKPLAQRLVERIKALRPQQMCRILNGTSRRIRDLSYGFKGDEKKMSVRIVFYKDRDQLEGLLKQVDLKAVLTQRWPVLIGCCRLFFKKEKKKMNKPIWAHLLNGNIVVCRIPDATPSVPEKEEKWHWGVNMM